MYVCYDMYLCKAMYVCMLLCMYVCIHVCMYVCMCQMSRPCVCSACQVSMCNCIGFSRLHPCAQSLRTCCHAGVLMSTCLCDMSLLHGICQCLISPA